MAQELIISISGMRGIIGENLFPDTAALYGTVFGTFLRDHFSDLQGNPRVVIGRDSRPSGTMLFGAVAAGLCSAGVEVIDLGICSTPAVGLLVRHLQCQGGVVITASHNPIEYNGIKLLLDEGMAPPAAMAGQIRQRFLDRQIRYVNSVQCGKISVTDQAVPIHVQKVLDLVDKKSIAAGNFQVVLDSVNGAGGIEGKLLLESLGCRVVEMNIEPTGLFAHKPEPTRENLGDLCRQVIQSGAQIGFAQDPDADRVAIVDEQGRYIGEEFSLALAAEWMFSQNRGASAAANLSTSRMIDDIAARYGANVIRTPVGEAHVAKAMMDHHCVIGGEGNGGVIDLRVGPIRDSLVGMALVLQLMAHTGKSVGPLADELGGYEMVKLKYPAGAEQAVQIIDQVCALYPEAKKNTSDGCRLDLPDGWIHIRTSNTEPIIRVILETRSSEEAKRITEQMETIVHRVLNA